VVRLHRGAPRANGTSKAGRASRAGKAGEEPRPVLIPVLLPGAMQASHFDPFTGERAPSRPAALRRASHYVCLRCLATAQQSAWRFCDHCGTPLGTWSHVGHAVPVIRARIALFAQLRARVARAR
jgi:hypothetical protein